MAGVRSGVTFDELVVYRSQRGMEFRTRPPAVVEGPIGPGTLDLPQACARAKRLTRRPFKFTLTGPHMLAKMLYDVALPEPAGAGDGDCRRARRSRCGISMPTSCRSTKQICPEAPDEWEWAAAAMNRVLDAVKTTPAVHLCFGNYGGQTIQKGKWEKLIGYLNALHVDHIVMETAHRPADELAVFRELRPEIGFGLGVVDIKSTEIETADQVARSIERAEQVLGRRAHQIHSSGLRVLDAEAQHRGRQNPRARAGARSPSRARRVTTYRSSGVAVALSKATRRICENSARVHTSVSIGFRQVALLRTDRSGKDLSRIRA